MASLGSPYLSDILVPYSTDLLKVCGALGDILKIIAHELQLVLDVLGGLNIDTGMHDNSPSDLLAQKVSVKNFS
jgi:hypothetical protein